MLMNLVTPEKKILTGVEVEEVIVPADRGELNILPGHAPLMTTLSVGVLQYRLAGSSEFQKVVISWGYCEVNPKSILILAETAETLEEIDKERALRAQAKASKQLLEKDLEPDQIKKFQRKLERSAVRINAMNKTTH